MTCRNILTQLSIATAGINTFFNARSGASERTRRAHLLEAQKEVLLRTRPSTHRLSMDHCALHLQMSRLLAQLVSMSDLLFSKDGN